MVERVETRRKQEVTSDLSANPRSRSPRADLLPLARVARPPDLLLPMLSLARQRAARAGVPGLTRGVGVLNSLLHGSPEAKATGDAEHQQHTKLVARGKYVHSFEVHKVAPAKFDEYKKAAERYYTGLVSDSDLHVKLTGSWETVVGETDQFVHILEFENYGGYDRTTQLIRESQHAEAYRALLPFVNSRTHQLNQEFAFFPTAPPHSQGGIFELRTYQLKPGVLLEWEHTWRAGIEARRKLVAPVGAWFSHVGRLHQVHHMWQYPSFAARKQVRQEAWSKEGWSETVSKTAELTTVMDASILYPLSYSPLK
ncbi:NIPSNAP-domain-containing protein [Auriculariales sp. MPI-PUGE-AT-0066]|nr:NIPSNAP-domain-containing protein [Auriculariales sp. MPI-PUGE-AT-0066]